MSKPTSVRELLATASAWLAEQGVDEARLDTELLLSHVLGVRRLDLYLDHDRPLTEPERDRFRALMKRRGAREPVAYLLGTRGFHAIELQVGPGALVPRPETEHLVEVGLERVKALAAAGRAALVVDVGTGTGCVALALLHAAPGATALGIDRSPQALAWAQRNRRALPAGARLTLVRGNLLDPVAPGAVDVVLSNPPYVTPDEAGALAPEVARWEPRAALFDDHGLPLTAALARAARRALRPGGLLAVETGAGKAPHVEAQLRAAGFVGLRRIADLAGIERVVAGDAG